AAADGRLALIYEDTCPQNGRCDIWARLFDAGGAPRANQVSQDNGDFIVNSSPTGTLTRPSIAAVAGGRLLGAWKILDQPTDLRVRVMAADGMLVGLGEQSVLATTTSIRPPDNIAVAALDRDRFLVVWQQERNPGAVNEPLYIRARVVLT